jgi:hypothetical protein
MLELIALALIALPLYLFVRFSVRAVSWLTGRRYRAYRLLANRYRGRYENRGLSDPPTVSFAYNGSTVRVGLAPLVPGQPSPPRTRVVVRFGRGLPFRMELAPASRPTPPQPPRGTRPVRTADPEFDRAFLVQANDTDMARDFLRGEVRQAVATLQRLGPTGGMLVSVNPERLLVQVDRNLAVQAEALATAVREALVIHDGLVTGVAAKVAEGVAVIAAGPAAPEDAGPPLCKVCGQLIDDGVPRTLCARCKAPHHRDCWEFIGGCSIFGCNGKEGIPA